MTGDEVRRTRRLLGLTQRQFGERVGVWRNTVARWERDELTVGTTAAILIRLLAEQARTPRRKGKRPNESNR
jgi:transcriptional regulator with XRE-family HTH domain